MTFTDDDIRQGAEYPPLGPAYFASRRIAERFMEAFQAEHFKSLVGKFEKEFSDRLWTSMSDHLMSDTESNLQGEMWRQVDTIVSGLLSGERWVMDRYVLGKRHDCEKVRTAVATHIPREVMDGRLLDLEEEVRGLRESLRFYQQR